MTQVVFNPATFILRYPEFANVPPAYLTLCFGDATLYLSNADNSPVQDIGQRTSLFNMLVAHIAFIDGALSADGQARPVGQTTSATEGTVSIGLANISPQIGSQAWYAQSQYGIAYWQATLPLRSFLYAPNPTWVQ